MIHRYLSAVAVCNGRTLQRSLPVLVDGEADYIMDYLLFS